METRPYLKVKEVEIILRMDLLSIEPNIKYGNYELLVEKGEVLLEEIL